jgi:MFS family permease
VTDQTNQARRARFGVCVLFLVCGGGLSTWAASVPAVQQKLGLTAGDLAVGVFGLAVGAVAAMVCASALLAKLGSRRVVVIGATVLCVSLPMVAFAPNLPVLVIALVVLGAGNSVLDVSMNAHAARVEIAYDRPIFAGFHAFWSIGGLAGSGLAALMALWQVSITVYFSAAGAVLFVAAMVMVRGFLLTGADQGQGSAAFALPSKALLALGLVAFCGFVAEGSVNDWSAFYLRNVSLSSAAFASLGYFAFSITMIGVRLVAERLVRRTGTVAFIRVATVVTVLGFALLVTVRVPAAGLVAFAVIGLGVSGLVPLAWSAAGRKQPQAPGRAIAAVAACGYLGFLTGPVIIGGLTSLLGLPFALGCIGAFTAVIYFLAPTMRTPAGTPTQRETDVRIGR